MSAHTRQHVEHEIRFLVDDPAVHRAAARLRRLETLRVIHRHRERQRNTYFDTRDLRLRQQRTVLKLREIGRLREAIVKQSLGHQHGVMRHREIAATITPSQRLRWIRCSAHEAVEPLRRARALAGDQPLQAIVTIRTDRHRAILARGEQRVELDVDHVRVQQGRRTCAQRLELEVENLDASPRVFAEAIAALRRRFRGMLRMSRVSKFEYGLRMTRALTRRSAGDRGGFRTRGWRLRRAR